MCAAQPTTNDGANTVRSNDNKSPNTKEYTMMMNTRLEQLRELKLAGMASGLQEQLTQAGITAMSFEERFGLLLDREVHWRGDKRRTRLLKEAGLKFSQACIEDIDTRAGHGQDLAGLRLGTVRL
jgi:hypothetical protein